MTMQQPVGLMGPSGSSLCAAKSSTTVFCKRRTLKGKEKMGDYCAKCDINKLYDTRLCFGTFLIFFARF